MGNGWKGLGHGGSPGKTGVRNAAEALGDLFDGGDYCGG